MNHFSNFCVILRINQVSKKIVKNKYLESSKSLKQALNKLFTYIFQVSKEDDLPQKICESCFQKLEVSINFRSQLLVTKNLLFNAMLKENVSLVSDQRVSRLSNSLEDTTLDLSRNKDSESLIVEKKISDENLINLDDSAAIKPENSETNESIVDKLQNDQENNNVDSDNSAENTFSLPLIKPDYDIESEIDVCSGEDDDVLELDVHKQNNETVEINSSSESEIEVCDYEPMGKRGNYNTYTPPIRF